ncbi:hypothetical protein [Ruegeria sp. AU67]|uniref:hypothetical protein n=1 Tax=Ruegeria sp. AU67 TaxID=2108530 RepID=UPI000D69D3E2|nr:hypothetical protein [Ruegeria sp. AU67]
MGALRFLGFALIVAMVMAGLDYYQQDKKTEGKLTASGYVEVIKQRFARFSEQKNAEELERERQKRWRAGGKSYLPETNNEWVRRAIVNRDFTLDAREGVLQDNISEAARPLAKKVAVQKTEQLASKMDRSSWVYENGEHTIWLQMLLKKDAKSNTLAGNIAQSIDAIDFGRSDYVPFGVIGGVAYFQFVQNDYNVLTVRDRAFWSIITASITDLRTSANFEIYKATLGLGQEIQLKAYSDAPAEEVHSFFSNLDYDRFNALLSRPVPGIGNASQVNPETEVELAVKMAEVRSEFMKLRGELAQLRLENVDGMALIANTMAAQYGLAGDTFDLTANKIESADDLVQVAYRKELSDLLEGQIEEANSGGNVFGRLFASFQGGEVTPKSEDANSAGFLGGVRSYFQSTSSAEAHDVRINKGSAGVVSKCATKDAFKKCSLTGG